MNRFGVSRPEILAFIRQYQRQHGAPPLFQEIADRFGFQSRTTARYHVDCLIAEGKLSRELYGNRTISLVDKPKDPFIHLLSRADYWQSLGCIVVYLGNPPTGFKAYWSEPFALAQEVGNV